MSPSFFIRGITSTNENTMKNTNIIIRSCFIFFAALAICQIGIDCSASEFFYPDGNVEIETLYFKNDGETITNKQIWQVIVKSEGDNTVILEFIQSGGDLSTSLCEVIIEKEDGERRIVWKSNDGKKELHGNNGFLPVGGYPVPCDMLPVYQKEPEKEYVLYKKVAGATFAERYTVKIENVDAKTAQNNGWIKSDGNTDSLDFMTVSAYNSDKKPVVKQLWEKNSDWWLYEETPYRRSWRIQ